MKTLATKHTRKKRNFNKKKLARQLESLSNKVAKRGVYVVVDSDPGYKVLNYASKSLVIDNIPFKSVANRLTKDLNKSKEKPSLKGLQNHIDKYYKYKNDILFYTNTVRTSEDKVRVFSAGVRLEEAIHSRDFFKDQINFYC